MFVAHLPAGYIAARLLGTRFKRTKLLTAAALLGSIFPDLDLFYFYLVDNQDHLHHSYWIHKPFYWLWITVGLVVLSTILNSPRLRLFCVYFLPNVFLHLILDTFVGHIRWMAPFSERSFALVDVPALYNWYVWNFVLHWTFLAEVALVVVAGALVVYAYLAKGQASRSHAELAP